MEVTLPLEFFDCEQGSPSWYNCRLGLPTASQFATVLAKGKAGAESLTRARYLRTLTAEIITGAPGENFTTPAMERGHAMEAEARELYAFACEADPALIGFIKNGRRGCSPDALLGDDGLLEIKTKRSDILIEVLLRDEFPAEHVPQCQGALWVAEREWIDLVCYWPGLPLFVKRTYRDEPYIRALSIEIDRFNEELDALVSRVRRYGMAPTDVVRDQLLRSAAL
jgi:hypothetical protein